MDTQPSNSKPSSNNVSPSTQILLNEKLSSSSVQVTEIITSSGSEPDQDLQEDNRNLNVGTSDFSLVEKFKLSDRLSRLRASSSSTDQDDTYIRNSFGTEPSSNTQYHKRKKQKESVIMVEGQCDPRVDKLKDLNSKETSAGFSLTQTPGRVELQGALANTTDNIIYDNITSQLAEISSEDYNLFEFLRHKFEQSRRDDTAVLTYIEGNYVARHVTGDIKQALRQSRQLLYEIRTYNLRNPLIAFSQLYYNMFRYYADRGKLGKAHLSMKAAVTCVQHQAPSLWTAQVCELQGYMYDRLAQVRSGQWRKYQALALQCYTRAREQHLHQPCVQDEDYIYDHIFYTLHMVHLTLDMPTLYTISAYPRSDMVYRRLQECTLSQHQVTQAQDMLRAVTEQANTLSDSRKDRINVRINTCNIFTAIRLAQLEIAQREYERALEQVKVGLKLYRDRPQRAAAYRDTGFDKILHLSQDMKRTLDDLNHCLTLRLYAVPGSHSDLERTPSSGDTRQGTY